MINHEETYKKYGYTYDELSDSSGKKIIVKCDYCDTTFEQKKQSNKNGRKHINKDACQKCTQKKVKEISLIKHGSENYHVANVRVKKKRVGNHNLPEDYSKEIFDLYNEGYSIKRICKKLNFGQGALTSFYKNNNLIVQGNIKEKKKKSYIDSYGVDHLFQSEEVKEQIKKTNIEKYGYSNPLKNPDINKKKIETCLKRYGCEHASQNKEVIERRKNTTKERYGYEFVSQNPEIKQKILDSRTQSGFNYLINDKTIKELEEETGYSSTTIKHYYNLYGADFIDRLKKEDATPSMLEVAMANILDDLGLKYETQVKIEKKIADFVLPEYNLVIEADGHYWHSEDKKPGKDYHANKKRIYKEHGYKSLFFREFEILYKRDIVESIVLNSIGKTRNSIGARKCKIEKLDKDIAKQFLIENHLMSHGSGVSFSLLNNKEIMTVIQIKAINKNNGVYEISRFCNKLHYNVPGAFSRLIKHAEQEIPEMKYLKTFVDLRYGDGEYLENFGFVGKKPSLSFCWVKTGLIFHRMKFPGDSGKSQGFSRLWDCGQKPFIKEIVR